MADDGRDEVTAAGGRWKDFDTGVAHSARVYNYWLGGKDNFAVDRAAGEMAIRTTPEVVESVRANRAFLARVVHFLTREAGIRQFLDIGTGIPAASNTHEVAQAAAPDARIVYVDNDPIVLAHARALLASHPAGVTDYIDADLREPGKILEAARGTLDLSRPVAVTLMAVLHFMTDADEPFEIVRTLMDAVPAGSYLALSHGAADIVQVVAGEAAVSATVNHLNRSMAETVTLRDHAAVTRFFDGLELVEPGVVPVSAWRPSEDAGEDPPAGLWGGVAVKK